MTGPQGRAPAALGFGPAAEPLIHTLQARTDIRPEVDFATCHAAEPQILTDWMLSQSTPSDHVVVLIDPSDSQAVLDLAAQFAHWQTPGCAYCMAVVLNGGRDGSSRSEYRAWRTVLSDAVDVAPQSIAHQRLAVQVLINGVMLLLPSIVGYDLADICCALSGLKRSWTVAAVWNRPDRRELVLERLCARYFSEPPNALLVFVHAAYSSFSLHEYSELRDDLIERMGLSDETRFDQTMVVAAPFLHADWPDERRVLGVTG